MPSRPSLSCCFPKPQPRSRPAPLIAGLPALAVLLRRSHQSPRGGPLSNLPLPPALRCQLPGAMPSLPEPSVVNVSFTSTGLSPRVPVSSVSHLCSQLLRRVLYSVFCVSPPVPASHIRRFLPGPAPSPSGRLSGSALGPLLFQTLPCWSP